MTKTGTNSFHGTASDTYWNQRWHASNFFAKQNYYRNIAQLNGQGRTAEADALAARPIQPAGHSNLWTLNATGPVRIPKLFDGRNKVFFSFNYRGQKDQKPEEPSTYNRVVPTADNKRGDFSDLLRTAVNPQQFQLYDPFSVRADPARPGHYLRTALPGNLLPAAYIGMGRKIYDNYVKYWPDPNNWFDRSTTPNINPYLSVSAPYNWDFNEFGGRLDTNIGDRMRVFGRYTQNHFVEGRGDWTIDLVKGLNNTNAGGTGVTRDDQNGVLDWVYTLSPRTMLHASASVSNWSSASTAFDFPFRFKPSDAGLPTYLDDRCAQSQCYLPLMNVTGYAQNGLGGIPQKIYNRFWGYNGDVSHNRGKHSLKFGTDIRMQVRSIGPGGNIGNYTFGNNYFRQCDDACGNGQYVAGGIGLSWASFMMGLPTGITISGQDTAIVANPYYAWFAQDTWRITPKLTLTLSLRTEYEVGATERFNRLVIDYDKNAVLPISSLAEAAYAQNPIPELPASQFKVLGGAVYANAAGAPRRAWPSQLMWLPRIGFGYQVDSRTVIRGGYGIYYDTLNVNSRPFGPNQTGYSRATNPVVSTAGANNVPVFNSAWNVAGLVSPLTDPFPVRPNVGNTRFDTPYRDTLGNMALVGVGWTYPQQRHPRQQRWRIGIERQFGTHNVIEAAYEGTYSTELNINVSQSAIPSTFYSRATVRDARQDQNLNASVRNPFNIASFAALQSSMPLIYQDMTTKGFYTAANTTKANLLRPFPNGNVTVPYPIGTARSQQFSLNFNRRFSRGLSANFAYTAMVTKQATSFFQPWSPFDPVSPQVPYWVRGGSAPHRVAATWVYDLPFGRGRAYLDSALAGNLVGGWTFSGTYEYSPGGLLGFGNNFYYGDPNKIKIENPTFDRWFDTSGCVATAAAARPGDIVVPVGQPCTQGWEKRAGQGPAIYQARTFPVNIDGLRGLGYQQWNGSVYRSFQIHEQLSLQLRMDAFNVFNHSFVGGPNTNPAAAQFGQITTGAANPNRFLQVQARIRW
jgi:hypothetical protein